MSFFIGQPVSQTPPRVEDAFRFVALMHQMQLPQRDMFGNTNGECRQLNKYEQATLNAALEVIRLYMTGENDYAPPAPPVAMQPHYPASEQMNFTVGVKSADGNDQQQP